MPLIQIPLNDVFRCFNDGGLVLFGADSEGKFDVMPCGWCAPWGLDRLLFTAGPNHCTRELAEASDRFLLATPTAGMAETVFKLGTTTMHEDPEKLSHAGLGFLPGERELPFPAGCSAWMILRRVREGLPQFPNALLFGIAEEAWVDGDLWRDGRPLPEEDLPLFKRRLRYEAGGAWYASKGRERVLQGAQGGRTG